MREHCGQPMMGVEYSYNCVEHYDGISEWKCVVCGTRIGRWSDIVLVGQDVERRFSLKDAGHA